MITDAHGRKVNFENTMIIMTTNAGSNITSSPAGFNKPAIEASKEKVQKALSDFLRPEFLNRIDEIVIFSPLASESFYDICSIMLSDLKKVLAEKNVELTWDEKSVDYLVKHGYDLKYGARNLRRLIQKQVEDKIADIMIAQAENWVGQISLSADENGIFIVT
ncbi:Chaperone protein ClpB [bioreactor metagenome]|uniref:Chaperone protein ClpB n=1 Tax=bioreactor metagenome TaxID=1076179 RepID=A0A645IH40_9ZZZZ